MPNAKVVIGVDLSDACSPHPYQNSTLPPPSPPTARCTPSQNLDEYHILLILTDGVINDFNQTVQSIVGASHLPLSVIIVGVGQADFQVMEALDSDGQLLKAGNNVAKRDIVQFVAYRDFQRSRDGRSCRPDGFLRCLPGGRG